MKWISVKDKLPEKYERVLVTDGKEICLHYKQSEFVFEDDSWIDLYPLEDGIRDSNKDWTSCCSMDPDNITHWMYISFFEKELK